MWTADETRVFSVSALDLRVAEGSWPFADRHRDEIAAHWQRRARETPGFFNGGVLLLADYALTEGERLRGRFIRTDFKSFLYWRETGHRDASVMDASGSGLVLSADGLVLLGRQRSGNLNSGLCYPPCGFIDARDIGGDGAIDIEASTAREIAEETGLTAPAIERAGGYVGTIAGPVLSIAVPYRSPLRGADLLRRVEAHLAADAASELAEVMLAPPGAACDDLPMPPYARALLGHLPGLKIFP